MKRNQLAIAIPLALTSALSCSHLITPDVQTNQATEKTERRLADSTEAAQRMIAEGRETFRNESFGSEDFWGGKLRLHEAIKGDKHKGVGAGLSPKSALKLGLKVDSDKLPRILKEAISSPDVNLEDPDTTLALLKADAVVGIRPVFENGELKSVGISCALCHSTVDDSFAKGIGRRLDGWPNRDLDVGAIVTLAPDLTPIAKALGTDVAQVKKALAAWGPGRYDAELNMDGKAFRPDGKTAATVLPAAFGLSGVNLHTYGGWGSVTHWNAYVAVTQMYGQGTFFDPRLNDPKKFPLAVKNGLWNVRPAKDVVTPKLAALHFYQLSLEPPKPKPGSFDPEMALRGQAVFNGKAKCASCHVPPLYVEPGYNMHAPKEIGIDDFQAKRSPTEMYRTTPLRGLFVREKGGFYHDGRFPTYRAVIDHYDKVKSLALNESEKNDLAEFLKSL